MSRIFLRITGVVVLSCLGVSAGSGGGPAVYTVGNIKDLSPGAEGLLILDNKQVTFRSGEVAIAMPYNNIHEAELGAKAMPPAEVPLYKVWQLHKRIRGERVMHQMLTLTVKDSSGDPQSLTLDMEEPAAVETLSEIEIRQGKRKRPTNGDSWWGDNVWKTTRNNNTVAGEPLGQSRVK